MDPERICVICRANRPKSQLVKLARLKTGRLYWAEAGTVGGKGVYLCRDGSCGPRLYREKKFRRLFLEPMDEECRRRFCQQFNLSEEP